MHRNPLKRPLDLSLYLVTQRGSHSYDDFLKIILASIEGGVKIVQLREKESSAREMITMGKRLLSYLRPLGIPLIINDRVDVAHALKADGVHLGQSDLRVTEARQILGPEAIIGLSVETLEQAFEAIHESVDYLAASPVLPTQTKSDCRTNWGFDGLKQLCAFTFHPIVAIGGMNETNVSEAFQQGASGVAVVSMIFNAACPKTAAQTLISKISNVSRTRV